MGSKRPSLVITAGPTREFIDAVRFISNPSTGKMGFAIAEAAAKRGFEVTLVAGPVALKTPRGVNRIDVVSAREMCAAVKSVEADYLIATAAVADFRPAKCAAKKLKKTEMEPVIRLVRNPDILKSVKGMKKVGFAAETDRVLEGAARKCREKGLEFIVANDVTEKGCGFGTDTNRVTLVFPDGKVQPLPLMTKRSLAKRIIEVLTGNRTPDPQKHS